MAEDTLAEESRTFEENVARWGEDHDGEFVLIQGTDVVGFYATNEQALSEGYRRFGVVPFFVAEVRRQVQADFISRLAAPTPVP